MAKIVESFEDIGKVRHVQLTLALATSDGEEPEELIYSVRGLSPKEEFTKDAIRASVIAPMPPMKKRVPDLGGGKLDASNLQLEEYYDYNDPTYLEQQKNHALEKILNAQRVWVYRLICGVKGFDLTDEQIKDKLGVEVAHPKSGLESLMKRIDQVSEIILPDADQIHLGMLVRKVMELSGVDFDAVNFTSNSSALLS